MKNIISIIEVIRFNWLLNFGSLVRMENLSIEEEIRRGIEAGELMEYDA